MGGKDLNVYLHPISYSAGECYSSTSCQLPIIDKSVFIYIYIQFDYSRFDALYHRDLIECIYTQITCFT